MNQAKPFRFTPKSFLIFLVLCITFGWIIGKALVNKSERLPSNNEESKSQIKNCIGNQDCISKVREHFTNTNKTILGEEYLGNGKFGISFLDPQRDSDFNAKIWTDCNCIITNVEISAIP